MADINIAYTKAQSVITKRRTDAFTRFENNLVTIKRELPKAAEIFEELSKLRLELVKVVFTHGLNSDDIEKIKQKQQSLSADLTKLLMDNGYPANFLEVVYTCHACSDTGDYGGKPCECFIKLVNHFNFEELCGVSQIKKCSFDTFSLDYYPEKETELGVSPKEKMAENLEICKNYAKDFSKDSKSIIMLGQTGLGKTHLSLAIATEVSKAGFRVLYGSAQNLLRAVEKEHFSGEDETIESILECDLLVLDDLGTEFESKFNVSQVYNIINSRLNFSRPTIISTNLTISELEARYEQRVVSRLVGEYISLGFIGNDVRQIKSRK